MTPNSSTAGSNKQLDHYERIHDAYMAHYYDPSSMAYRERFFYDYAFAGLNLNGLRVADLACGDGFNSLALKERFPGARTVGFDLSPTACATYRSVVGEHAYELDLTRGQDQGLPLRFEAALVIGGLHHCVADLAGTFRTIEHLVSPGGVLLMVEANAEFLLEGARRIWYRADSAMFEAETEHALTHEHILQVAGPGFRLMDCRYLGGPAYFLVLNSMVLRIPLCVKPLLTQPLFAVERLLNRLPWPVLHPYFVARWKRVS